MCLRDTPPFVPNGPKITSLCPVPSSEGVSEQPQDLPEQKGAYSRCLAVPIQHNMVPPPKNPCQILPWKLKIVQKMGLPKRKVDLQPSFFRGYAKLGGRNAMNKKEENPLKKENTFFQVPRSPKNCPMAGG